MLSNMTERQKGSGINIWDVGQVAEYGTMFVGDLLLTTRNWQQLRLYDRQLQRVATLHHEHNVDLRLTTAAPDGSSLVTVSRDETLPSLVQLWRWPGGKVERKVLHHTALVTRVAYRADGRRIATADSGGRVKVWDGAGRHQYTFEQDDEPFQLAFDPADPARLLMLTSPDDEQRLYTYTGRQLLNSQPTTAPYTSLSCAAVGGSYLLHGRHGYELRSSDGRVLFSERIAADSSGYLHLAALGDGWLLTCDDAGRVAVRSAERSLPLADPGAVLREGQPDNSLLTVAADAASRRLVITSTNLAPYVWDRRSGSGAYLPHLPDPQAEEVEDTKVVASINRSGNLAATASWGQLWQPSYTRLWAVTSGGER